MKIEIKPIPWAVVSFWIIILTLYVLGYYGVLK